MFATATSTLEPDKFKWKPINMSCIILGNILIIMYDDDLDQLLTNKWNVSNARVSFDSSFSGYIYYKRYYLRRISSNYSPWAIRLWGSTQFPVGYNSWQTNHCVTISLMTTGSETSLATACPACHSGNTQIRTIFVSVDERCETEIDNGFLFLMEIKEKVSQSGSKMC